MDMVYSGLPRSALTQSTFLFVTNRSHARRQHGLGLMSLEYQSNRWRAQRATSCQRNSVTSDIVLQDSRVGLQAFDSLREPEKTVALRGQFLSTRGSLFLSFPSHVDVVWGNLQWNAVRPTWRIRGTRGWNVRGNELRARACVPNSKPNLDMLQRKGRTWPSTFKRSSLKLFER